MCSSPNTITTQFTVSWLLVLGTALWISGCHKPPPSAKYVPSPELAQRAVDVMLKSWQAGDPPGEIANSIPAVHITDAHRKPGQKLVEYQILGEVPGDAGRCFAVKAKFSNPAAEERIRFVVIGIEPLWVFRHEDFELLMHWEHKMDPVPEGAEKSQDAKSVKSELNDNKQ